jgi:outer membrane receptor protein involved in Fe transport
MAVKSFIGRIRRTSPESVILVDEAYHEYVDDRTYATAGFRGFSSLGDYGSRVLVLVDGMPVNDDWIGSSYLGYDQRTDLEDIERIEIVRGTGSVLYGTGAMSGVVNLVPRGRGTPTGVEAGISSTEEGTSRARVAGSFALSEETGGWVMAGVAKGFGVDLELPALATPGEPGSGRVEGIDGFEAATTTGRLWSGDFNLQWGVNQREKKIPTAPHQTIGELTVFPTGASSRAAPRAAAVGLVTSRAHANRYGFDDELPTRRRWRPAAGQFRARGPGSACGRRPTRYGSRSAARCCSSRFTAGQILRQYQRDRTFQIGATCSSIGRSSTRSSLAGARLDAYSTFGTPSTRGSRSTTPWDGTVKLFGGKAFRAEHYELYYADGGRRRSRAELDPETS